MKHTKNPTSVAQSAITGAQVSSKITTMKAQGEPDKTIAKEVLKDINHQELRVFLLLMQMNRAMGWPGVGGDNDTFLGYGCILQHYRARPEAMEFEELLRESKTIGQVWAYFKKVNALNERTADMHSITDPVFFAELLDKPILSAASFGFNLEHAGDIKHEGDLEE